MFLCSQLIFLKFGLGPTNVNFCALLPQDFLTCTPYFFIVYNLENLLHQACYSMLLLVINFCIVAVFTVGLFRMKYRQTEKGSFCINIMFWYMCFYLLGRSRLDVARQHGWSIPRCCICSLSQHDAESCLHRPSC